MKSIKTIWHILWLVVSFFSVTASAQILIKADDKSIRYDLIKPAHYFQKVTGYDSAGAIIYEFVNENTIKVDAGNQQIIFSRSRQIPFGQNYLDTSTLNISGTPVSYQMLTNPLKKNVDATFSQESETLKINGKGTESAETKALPAGYFDDNIIEDLLGYIPFKKGEKYHLSAFTTDVKSRVNPFELEYVFDDFYQAPSGNLVKCSVLHYTNARSNAYVWIDQISHANLKEVLQYPDGKISVLLKI